MKNIIYNYADIDHISSRLVDFITNKVVCLIGDLGAGKTTLVKHIVKIKGASEAGNSPTFGIINEYRNKNDEIVAYHLDCYRLESAEEALDLGIEEYLNSGCLVFIEWPDRIEELLPLSRTEIQLRLVDANTRELSIRNLKE